MYSYVPNRQLRVDYVRRPTCWLPCSFTRSRVVYFEAMLLHLVFFSFFLYFLRAISTALSTHQRVVLLPSGCCWYSIPGLLPARQMRLSVCAFETMYIVRTYAATFGTHNAAHRKGKEENTQTHTLTRIPVWRRCRALPASRSWSRNTQLWSKLIILSSKKNLPVPCVPIRFCQRATSVMVCLPLSTEKSWIEYCVSKI